MKNSLGEKIIKKRKELSISQRELARRIEIDDAYLSRIEKGTIKKPSIKIIIKLCKELDLNSLELIFETYTPREIEISGAINNKNDIFNWLNESDINKYKITDENKNERLSLVKILNEYKNEKIDLEKCICLLSYMMNDNIFDYLTEQEFKNLKNKHSRFN